MPRLTPACEHSDFRSLAFRRVVQELERFAKDPDVPVLIEGESGTGKTMIARHVHRASPRAAAPFESVVLSAIDDGLASSELFGHLAGAFTDARRNRTGAFALAQGGTLFLDEIGKASPAVQQKLLHAIEYGEIRPLGADRNVHVDARFVAATNVCLATRAVEGSFLPDLYARLGTFTVRLPALRERRADIPVLARRYVERLAPKCGYPGALPTIGEELSGALQQAEWPFNLRQLHATMHRLLLEAEGAPELSLAHCRGTLGYLMEVARSSTELSPADIDQAIERAGGNVSRAAALLGVDRTTIYRRRRRVASDSVLAAQLQ